MKVNSQLPCLFLKALKKRDFKILSVKLCLLYTHRKKSLRHRYNDFVEKKMRIITIVGQNLLPLHAFQFYHNLFSLIDDLEPF
jgi:hypothetical protein